MFVVRRLARYALTIVTVSVRPLNSPHLENQFSYILLSTKRLAHIEEHVEQLKREGMSPREAERQARISFGNLALVEERSREVWQWPTLESIWSDVRFALRQLRRSPGFTIAAVLTLALAIGANAVVFSILNAFLLRPLNVARPESLYQLQHGYEASAYQSYPDYLDLRKSRRT